MKDGGEGGIRTLDTLPYTHFPGVLLQPLGHLTKLLNHRSGTALNLGKSAASVNQLFCKKNCLAKLPAKCWQNQQKTLFFLPWLLR